MNRLLSLLSVLLDPRGRLDRSGLLVAAVVLVGLEVLLMLGQSGAEEGGSAVVWVFKGLSMWIGCVGIIKRLHDMGYRGWWLPGGFAGLCMWTALVAVTGFLFAGSAAFAPGSLSVVVMLALFMLPAIGATLWLHLTPGEPFANAYGAPPRNMVEPAPGMHPDPVS